MEKVKRDIKFCYYKVAIVDPEGKVIEKYNLTEWFRKMETEELYRKNIQLSDCKVHFDKIELVDDKLYYGQAFKLREVNIPSKIRDGKRSEPIELEYDEFIGEDINFLYDRKNSVCMLQQNRNSIGVKRLVEWINKYYSKENSVVAFIPISAKFTPNRFHNKTIRKIEFSFANMMPENPDGSLGSIIKSFESYHGISTKIVISSDRVRSNELNKANIVDLVDELQSNPGIVRNGKVSLRENQMHDDDKAHVEVVDIFENALNSIISFDIEKRKPLHYGQAKTKMMAEYIVKRPMIEELCR